MTLRVSRDSGVNENVLAHTFYYAKPIMSCIRKHEISYAPFLHEFLSVAGLENWRRFRMHARIAPNARQGLMTSQTSEHSFPGITLKPGQDCA